MDTGEALLRAVLADKADDLPRLVYADWLDENGDADRAEFIRIQCELAKPEHKICVVEVGGRGCICRTCLLKTRERDLFARNHVDWLMSAPGARQCSVAGGRESRGVVGMVWGPEVHVDQLFRRGFIAEVRCTMAAWCGPRCVCRTVGGPWVNSSCCNGTGVRTGIGPQVVKRNPVERVALTNAEPFHGTVGHAWLRESSTGPLDIGHRNIIPDGVFDLIEAEEREEGRSGRYKSFATRELADKALSDACIKWAESQIT